MTTPHEAPAVAMTEEHLDALDGVTRYNGLVRYAEARANIRSQVQGMKLYDPATHVVVARGDLNMLLTDAASMVGDAKNYSICVSVSTIRRWLTGDRT